ncbi:MAG: hypothetical protein WDW36_001362 [Sanguina aurantia]
MTSTRAIPHVVIIGGGFGGLSAARGLASADVRITLVDRTNHHLFQPLLYEVATAGLSGPDIAAPLRHILRGQKNVTIRMETVTSIDVAQRRVVMKSESLEYDWLIVATGSSHAYFGHDDWEVDAPGMKTMNDALLIRRHILNAFEAAEREPDPVKRAAWLSFVVIGAGPTGVELAGTLAEIAHHTLAKEFRVADPHSAQIHLVEAGPRVLGSMAPVLSAKAHRQLERMQVLVHINSAVTGVSDSHVQMGEKRIEARTLVWAAGVAASALGKQLDTPGRGQLRGTDGQPTTLAPDAPFTPTVYLYDAFPGGIGQSEPLFDRREDLIAQSVTLIERCDCRCGCPGCVGPVLAADEDAETTPKALALRVLALLIKQRTAPARSTDREVEGDEIAPGLRYTEATMDWLRPPATVDTSFALMDPVHHYRLLHFDTETTGLAGGTGTRAFMIGAADWIDGRFRIRQLTITSMAAETAMLRAFAGWLSDDTVLVSYNGKCYDAPLLATRYRLARLPNPLMGLGGSLPPNDSCSAWCAVLGWGRLHLKHHWYAEETGPHSSLGSLVQG